MRHTEKKNGTAPATYAEMLGHTCRSCINDAFGIHLRTSDCIYEWTNNRRTYRKCDYCHANRHVVTGLKLIGKIKMLPLFRK